MKKKVLIFVLSLFVHFVDAQKVEVTRFALEAIHTEIPEGWKKGRLPFNTIWINNGEQNKLIPKNEQIPEGWKKGKLNKPRSI